MLRDCIRGHSMSGIACKNVNLFLNLFCMNPFVFSFHFCVPCWPFYYLGCATDFQNTFRISSSTSSRNMDSMPGTPHTIASYCDPHSPITGSISSHRTTPLASMGYSGGVQSGPIAMQTNAEMSEEHDLHLAYDQA